MDLRLTARLTEAKQEHDFILAQLYPTSYDFFNSIKVKGGDPIEFAIDLVCEETDSVMGTIFANKETIENVFDTRIPSLMQAVNNETPPEDYQSKALDYICFQLAAGSYNFNCSIDASNIGLFYSAGSHRYLKGKFNIGIIVQLAGGWRIIQQAIHEISYLPLDTNNTASMGGQLFARNGSNIQISKDALIVRLDELKGGQVMAKMSAKALADSNGYAHLARYNGAQAIINTLDSAFIYKSSDGYFDNAPKATRMKDDLPLDEYFIKAANEALQEHLTEFFAGVAG